MGRGVHKGGVIFLPPKGADALQTQAIVGPLCLGSHGDGVRIVQTLLNEPPWNARLDLDGLFGIKTHRALVEFQRQRALRTDGVVGPRTAAALGLTYDTAPGRRIAPTPGEMPRHHLPSALEIIADALAPPMIDFMKLIKKEILKTGAEEDKMQNAAKAMDEDIIPAILDRLKDWSQSPVTATVWMDLQMHILEVIVKLIGETILTYLKRHGGNVTNVVARIDKLDAGAIAHVVQRMLDGKESADAAVVDIQRLMRRALA
jgi:hypothetical protein